MPEEPDEGPTTALAAIGSDEGFLFLAADDRVSTLDPADCFAAVELDDQVALLGLLSQRFRDRVVLERFPDGYRSRTTSRAGLRRRSSFESVTHLVHGAAGAEGDPEPCRSIERQFGERTDLRYETTYAPDPAGTRITVTQSYLAKRTTMESGAAITQLRRRATEVVTARLDAIDTLLGGASP